MDQGKGKAAMKSDEEPSEYVLEACHKQKPAKAGYQQQDGKPIKFKDCVGRTFIFPWADCKTWLGTRNLVQLAVLRNMTSEDIIKEVEDGNYDLLGPGGEIIVPELWENTIQPGWQIRMKMWNFSMAELMKRKAQRPEIFDISAIPEPPPVKDAIKTSRDEAEESPTSAIRPSTTNSFLKYIRDGDRERLFLPPPPPEEDWTSSREGANSDEICLEEKSKTADKKYTQPEQIPVVSREVFEREDQRIVDEWKSSITGVNWAKIHDMWQDMAPEGYEDLFEKKLSVISALLSLPPNQTGAWISRMLLVCSESNETVNYKDWLDILIVVLKTLREKYGQPKPESTEKLERRRTKSTFDSILEEIYRRQILLPLSSISSKIHHQTIVRKAIQAVNIWNHKTSSQSLASLGLSLPYENSDAATDADYPTRFKTNDLDIVSLRRHGKLKIKWTDIIEDHLRLDYGGAVDDSSSASVPSDELATTLHIYWFDTEAYGWLGSYFLNCKEQEATLGAREVRHTWTFLFQSNSLRRKRTVERGYKNLIIPVWVKNYFTLTNPHTTLGSIMKDGLDKHCFEISQHQNHNLFRYNYFKKGGFQYSLFPVYRERIQQLRDHMDNSKPKGFVGLLRDQRDPALYLTVVGAFFLGIVAIILTFLSLVAGIVQAWASVKALHQ